MLVTIAVIAAIVVAVVVAAADFGMENSSSPTSQVGLISLEHNVT